jgi:hypothetical protein
MWQGVNPITPVQPVAVRQPVRALEPSVQRPILDWMMPRYNRIIRRQLWEEGKLLLLLLGGFLMLGLQVSFRVRPPSEEAGNWVDD